MKIDRLILTSVTCAALVCLPALGARRHEARHAQHNKAFDAQEFINTAAQADMLQAHLGEITPRHSGQLGIRQLGAQIAEQKKDDYRRLALIAAKLGLQVPKGIDDEGNRTIAKFDKLTYAPFDKLFLQTENSTAEREIKAFEQAAQEATNPELKQFATDRLPTLKLNYEEMKDFAHYHVKGV